MSRKCCFVLESIMLRLGETTDYPKHRYRIVLYLAITYLPIFLDCATPKGLSRNQKNEKFEFYWFSQRKHLQIFKTHSFLYECKVKVMSQQGSSNDSLFPIATETNWYVSLQAFRLKIGLRIDILLHLQQWTLKGRAGPSWQSRAYSCAVSGTSF